MSTAMLIAGVLLVIGGVLWHGLAVYDKVDGASENLANGDQQ